MELTPAKLSRACQLGFDKLSAYRAARAKFITEFVGRFYSTSGEGKARPLNLLHSAIATLVPNLVYNDPTFIVKSRNAAFGAYAESLGMALTHLCRDEIRLRDTVREVIIDALFGVGIIKTGIASSGHTLDLGGSQLNVGYPYADRVDLDDFVCDPMARHRDEFEFVGHKFRIREQEALESGLVTPEQVERFAYKTDSDENQKAVSKLSDAKDAQSQYAEEVTKYLDLVEIYLPNEQLIVTIPHDRYGAEAAEILRVVEYEGPERGPYHLLGFGYVPDNPLPVPQCGIWFDLHEWANRIARKLGDQAMRNKRVLAFEGTAQDDAQAIVDADDGDTVKVDNINAIKEVEFGGHSDQSIEFVQWVQQKFSEMTGNLELLAGTDSKQATATQAEMLASNSSVRLADMQQVVYHFVAEVGRDLAFFVHSDPLIDMTMVKRVRGTDVPVRYSPEMREGEWFDYAIDVKPYSMARTDPNLQVRRKMEFATNVIPAAVQAFTALGPGFVLDKFLDTVARDIGIDDVEEFINMPAIVQSAMAAQMMMPPTDGKAGGGGATPMPMGMPGMAPPPGSGMGQQGGMRIGQPNPSQMGPSGGMTPNTEIAMAQQEVAGELQGAYLEPSIKAMALAR